MAKKLVAVTEIRHNDEIIPAGETLDTSKFDKKQLEALYDAGAVRVDDGADEAEKTSTETPENTETVKPATSATAAPTPAKSVAAPASKETANAKGSGK